MTQYKGGGDRGAYLEISCVPDSDFATEIAALIAAGTQVTGKLVALTWGANYQVTSPAEDARFDGKIVHYEKTSSSYRLTVRMCHYVDQNSAHHTPVCIMKFAYSGTLALQDSVILYDGNYLSVDDGSTGGWGAVIAIDNPSGYADVIF